MEQVRIVLVEPAGALNVGSIARVMKNMGLSQLVLVNPQCNPLGEEAQLMAVHGDDVLSSAKIVETLPEALQGCQRVIATTARQRSYPINLESPEMAMSWLLAPNISSALIFGPEERGLSNLELNYAQRFVCIPSNPEYPSLNLAQAVAICGYEIAKAHRSLELSSEEIPPSEITPIDAASVDDLEGYYQDLESLLLKIGYVYPHTAQSRMEKLRRLFNQANLNTSEVAMLRGILRQMNWALKQK